MGQAEELKAAPAVNVEKRFSASFVFTKLLLLILVFIEQKFQQGLKDLRMPLPTIVGANTGPDCFYTASD